MPTRLFLQTFCASSWPIRCSLWIGPRQSRRYMTAPVLCNPIPGSASPKARWGRNPLAALLGWAIPPEGRDVRDDKLPSHPPPSVAFHAASLSFTEGLVAADPGLFITGYLSLRLRLEVYFFTPKLPWDCPSVSSHSFSQFPLSAEDHPEPTFFNLVY